LATKGCRGGEKKHGGEGKPGQKTTNPKWAPKEQGDALGEKRGQDLTRTAGRKKKRERGAARGNNPGGTKPG